MTPVTTGGVALSSAGVAASIAWVASLYHVQMPDVVAGTIAGTLFIAGHYLGVAIKQWWTSRVVPTPVPAAPPAA